MLIGLVVCLKITHLWPNAGLLYAADGVLPLHLLERVTPFPWAFASAYTWVSSEGAVQALLLFHAGVAIAFVVGWRTRWMNLFLWFLTLSLNLRSPMILNGGDRILTSFLFWGIFLPLGACYSIDALRRHHPLATSALTRFGEVVFILQVFAIYLISGYLKWHAAWIYDFDALENALLDESYALPLAHHLVHFPIFLKLLTIGTIYLEQLFILLFLSPVWNTFFRIVIPGSFILLHAGIALTLDIGVFPYTCIAVWLALLPPWLFDRLGMKQAPVREEFPSPIRPWLAPALATAVMAFLVSDFLSTRNLPRTEQKKLNPVRMLNLIQRWGFYAPYPATTSRWFAIQSDEPSGAKHFLFPYPKTITSPQEEASAPFHSGTYYFRKHFHALTDRRDPELYEASAHGFHRYRPPAGGETPENLIVIRWERTHYPRNEKGYVRTVLYSTQEGMPEQEEDQPKTVRK